MTAVNVTTQKNTVSIDNSGDVATVTVTTAGPQGPLPFAFDGTAKVDKSVVYYDSASGEFRADDIWTISTIVKGGDF